MLLFGKTHQETLLEAPKIFSATNKTQQMLKGEQGKRCQRPPKAPAPADAHCQKTDLSRVQTAKAFFLSSTIATATLSGSALWLARSLGASHFFYTSLLGHLFPLRSCPIFFTLLWGILLRTRFLSFTLLFGISFVPPSFSIFYASLGVFLSPLLLLHFSLEYFFSPFDLLIFCTSLWHFLFFALLAFHLLMLLLAISFRILAFHLLLFSSLWPFLSTSLAFHRLQFTRLHLSWEFLFHLLAFRPLLFSWAFLF